MKKLLILILALCRVAQAGVHVAPDNMLNKYQWSEFEQQLGQDKDREIIIRWGGFGGEIPILEAFIGSLRDLQAQGKTITMEVVTGALSCHAIAVCYADIIKWDTQSFLMFHPASIDVKEGVQSTSAISQKQHQELRALIDPCVQRGIITAEQADASNKDKEVYVKKVDGIYKYIIKQDPRQL